MQSTSRDFSSGSEPRPALGNEQRDTVKPQAEATQPFSNDERDALVDNFVSSSSNQDLPCCSGGETIAKSEKLEDTPSASESRDVTQPAKTSPLGLGVNGLE